MPPILKNIRSLSVVLALLVLPQSVFALLNIDGTRNQIFVFGELSLAYDSNIFAQKNGGGDTITTMILGTEYRRGAGTISVLARGQMAYEGYSSNSDLNAWNPSFRLELARTNGRLTGSLILGATRASRAETALNLRTSSWTFPIDLNLKYPISEKLYLTSTTSYLRRNYEDSVILSNIAEYSQSVDIFRVYTSKLDLLGGYRVRFSETDAGHTSDHNFSFGATGGLLPKLNGMVRFGYQFRNVDATSQTFNAFSALAQLNWNATRKFAMVGRLSRDFSTTANTYSVDSITGNLHANYIFTRRWQADAGIGYGRNRFLNGPTDSRGRQRHDDFVTWDAGITYTWSDKFKVSLSYVYLKNWSTLDVSDFTSNGVSLSISSRF